MIGKLIGSAGFLSSGGTIGGDLTISGDLTVSGGGTTFDYSEVLTGDMKITHTAASTAFEVQQDTGAGIALLIDQNTNQNSLQIDTASTAYSAIQIASPATMNGNIVGIYGVDSITTGRLMYLESDSPDASSRKLIDLVNNNTAATGATCLHIQQDSTGSALTAIGAAGSGSASGAVIKLQTSETTVVDGDYLGRIEFSAPAEASGTDAILAGAAIWAEADDTFAADNNSTELVFGTNTSAAYTERMRINSSGNVGIGESAPGAKLQVKVTASASGHSSNCLRVTSEAASSGNSLLMGVNESSAVYTWIDGKDLGVGALPIVINEGGGDVYLGGSYSANTGMKIDANSRISLSNNDGGSGNTVFGKSAGNALASGGTNNVFIGEAAGLVNTVGDYNVAIGHYAYSDTNAGNNALASVGNVAIGRNAMGGTWADAQTDNCVAIGDSVMTGVLNDVDGTVAIGTSALASLTSGGNNTAIGYNAGATLTTGEKNILIGNNAGDGFDAENANIAIGYGAFGGAVNGADKCIAIGTDTMTAAATQDGTIAIGHDSMTGLTTGEANTALGYQALKAQTTGGNNVALGYQALETLNHANADGNTAVGYNSLQALATGVSNTAVGVGAADSFEAGETDNTVIGANAMGSMMEGNGQVDQNVALGVNALLGKDIASSGIAIVDNIAIGTQAMDSGSIGAQTGTIAIGAQALGALTSGSGNTAVGYQAGLTYTDASNNTAVGYNAGYRTVNGASGNTILGASAFSGAQTGSDTGDCVAIGYLALSGALSNADGSVAVGKSALAALTSGAGNVAIGYQALQEHTEGSRNLAIGYQAMYNTWDGSADDTRESIDNIGIGYQALGGAWTDSDSDDADYNNYNVGIGNYVMDAAMAGASNNTAVGNSAATSVTTGDDNVCIGSGSGGSITTGNQNTIIGSEANTGAGNNNNLTAIGYDCEAPDISNAVVLGNGDVTAVYMADDATSGTGADVYCKDVYATHTASGDPKISFMQTTTSRAYIQWADNSGDEFLQFVCSENPSYMRFIPGGGSVALTIATDGTFTGSSSNDISDKELKENIQNVENGLDTIKKLQGRSFTWKEDAKMQSGKKYGLIAQELEKVLPDLVYNENGIRQKEDGTYYKSITMNGVIPFLIEAVKELSAKVEALEKK